MVRARRSPPDGRVNSGGSRQGSPSQSYPQRADLRTQKIQTVPNQEYGKASAQAAAQRVVPMAGTPPAPNPQAPGAGGGSPFVTAEDVPNLFDPTARPHEPLTHGLSSGPGAGPEALMPDPAVNSTAERLRALYLRFPTPELRELLAALEVGQ